MHLALKLRVSGNFSGRLEECIVFMSASLSTREDENAEHAQQNSDDRTEHCEPQRPVRVCDGMTFRMHDDSSPFVRPFAIDREQPDYQYPEIDIVIMA